MIEGMILPRPFTKIESNGNDYVVVLDERYELELDSEQIAAICDRHRGIGATGLVRLSKTEPLHGDAPQWLVDARNADGTVAELRGDEVIAAVERLAANNDVPTVISSRAGELEITRSGDQTRVALGRWRLAGGEPLVAATRLDVPRPGLGVELCTPHVVVALSSAEELDQLDLRDRPELDPAPFDDATVVFVVPGDPLIQAGRGCLAARVYDRMLGEVPGGAVAAGAAALAVRYWAGSGAPRQWEVRGNFGTNGVSIELTEQGETVSVTGSARRMFTGECCE
ncbi:diaminopimelate epimerase [Gulosibacter hominis]|uniref:diaminopimelate epimerase n=1 Tax=Gulosibacter hominis TaxID=2770504 RepID=UPI001919FD07|nr:diaminopimelate epimerase [Gulosibacter hominis]